MKWVISIIFLLFLISCVTPQKTEAQQMKLVELAPNSEYTLETKIVQKTINGKTSQMYAYNEQIPGPTLKVKQNSKITLNFKNSIDMPTTIHWHGVRLDNKYDGVEMLTQKEILPGETFQYELKFPDDGIYWYHPHMREDKQQELGLYGAILVEPEATYPPVDREEIIFLDDIRTVDGYVESFLPEAHYVLMGRFGDTMLLNGQTNYTLNAKTGETIRLYLINSANARTYNFSIEKTQLKIIGADSGLYEKEYFADNAIISPSERIIAEVTFNEPGIYNIQNKNPIKTHTLGTIKIEGEETSKELELKRHETVTASIAELKEHFNQPPDYEIELTMQMGHGMMEGHMMSMNTESIEWEDTMETMNARSTPSMVKWIMKDKKTGKENHDLKYQVNAGDIKKIRFYNNPNSMHPMQHPIHLHGQRFLVLDNENNYVWKDTVLVPTGKTVDIIVHFTNPGDWAFHCHIAEHLEAGMMATITVNE